MDVASHKAREALEVMSPRDFYLPWRQEWRQFTTEKKIFDKGVWIEIDNVKNVAGRPKALLELFEDWQKFQWLCWHDGLIGWFCAVERNNDRLEKILQAIGAEMFQEDDTYRYYYRHTIDMPDVVDFKEFHRRIDQGEGVSCPS